MKNRLTTLDIAYLIYDLRQKLLGLRVDQIYDIDKKTYLIRFAKTGVKKVLLLESGTRFHTTSFEWPKNAVPSGFSMKLRKHLNNKRLEKIEQVGADRIVHLQFGIDTSAHHLILELYDKGNIILTDYQFTILSLVRPRVHCEERLVAYEKYNLDTAKQNFSLDQAQIKEILTSSTSGTLREIFLSKLEFGPTLFAHVLKSVGLTPQTKIADLISTESKLNSTENALFTAFEEGRNILENISDPRGLIVLSKQGASKNENTLQAQENQEEPLFYDQFHPWILSSIFESEKKLEFESFDVAVDEFFSKIESQKLDMKQLQQEREAIKKLEKVKLDQNKRLKELQEGQETDKQKAELITVNQAAVDQAILAIRKLVANQISWDTIEDQLNEARSIGDPLASMISKLNLKQNSISLNLRDPYDEENKTLIIDVDLNLSAYSNATKYFDLKKASARKEERTLESQGKAFKSTEKKTIASLKEAAAIHSIKKARKILWFEKFRWFITSENYLVLGGRDAQQNELLVKKYLRPRDVYMHADAHGAPTLIIKNDNVNEDVPPKTLNETGVYAISCSGSWESKVVTTAWWVWGDQVSKSAPTGEYLPTGSFMIRGKKNYLPQTQLVLGFGFLFRLTEDCVEAHKNERTRKTMNDLEDIPQVSETLMEEEEEFPDTHVDVKIDGNKVRTRLASTGDNFHERHDDDDDPTEFFVTSGLPTINASVQKLKNKQKKINKIEKQKPKSSKTEIVPVKTVSDEILDGSQPKPKRGQHGRKKKLKEKYKFQDDEERHLRMQLIRTGQAATMTESGTELSVETTEIITSNKEESDVKNIPELDEDTEDNVDTSKQRDGEPENSDIKEIIAEDDEEEQEEESRETELDLLKSLTGSPLENDELLYAVPVIAPYSTLQNYKFRIKMTPGTTKRGKAAKAVLESFLRDKEASPREKDLIKAVKDQDLARNFPGKVKLSNIIRDKK